MLRKSSAEQQEIERLKNKVEAANLAAQKARDQAVVADERTGGSFNPANLSFSWHCSGDDKLKPTNIFNNQDHTYIKLREDYIRGGDLPAVFNRSNSKDPELLNARMRYGYYIIDGRPTKLELTLGVGRDAQRVTCERDE